MEFTQPFYPEGAYLVIEGINMDSMQKLEESMKVLDMLSIFLLEESDNYIESEDIRSLLQGVFEKIRDIYESNKDDCLNF